MSLLFPFLANFDEIKVGNIQFSEILWWEMKITLVASKCNVETEIFHILFVFLGACTSLTVQHFFQNSFSNIIQDPFFSVFLKRSNIKSIFFYGLRSNLTKLLHLYKHPKKYQIPKF